LKNHYNKDLLNLLRNIISVRPWNKRRSVELCNQKKTQENAQEKAQKDAQENPLGKKK
jgi:hypothetical protein